MDKLLRLPPRYDLVVGDTFELFYKGIVFCKNSDFYDFELSFTSGKNLGKGFDRKYIWEPTAEDVGTHTLRVRLRSNEGELLDEGTVDLCVHPLPTSPESEKVVLVIGDSLTAGGAWVKEFYRRLTAEGGTPAGLGLTNIKMIGAKGEGGALHEGYGGWRYTSFTTPNVLARFQILTGDFSEKNNDGDQHSTYRDEVGNEWKIEYVTQSEMKIIGTSAFCTIPAEGGRLTHVSGGVNHGDILYTSARPTEGNPFWDVALGRNNFTAYAKKFGADHIDEAIVLLGWNSVRGFTAEVFGEQATVLLDSLLAEFPQCHITLVTLQVPSRNGFANNYGISWPWFDVLRRTFEFQDVYYRLADDPRYRERISVVSLAGQYDSVYNEIKMELSANNRNATVETVGANGVHPSPAGYLQIADAVYRHFCHRLAKGE